MSALSRLATAATDLVLGSCCVGCARAGSALCLMCAVELEQCPFVAWPTPRPRGMPTPYAVAAYAGAVRSAVVAHKEHSMLSLARPLGRALALSVLAAVAANGFTGSTAGPVRLVWPPSAEATVRERGHDPLQRIVHACQRSLRAAGVASIAVPALTRTRSLADQAGLSAQERATNLSGALVVRPRCRSGVAGKEHVVVDDVLTTGATATEVVRALVAAGARVPAVAVIAATERRAG